LPVRGASNQLQRIFKIGSKLSGRLKSVNVEEGDAIQRGQVLAELENADDRAAAELARANLIAPEVLGTRRARLHVIG